MNIPIKKKRGKKRSFNGVLKQPEQYNERLPNDVTPAVKQEIVAEGRLISDLKPPQLDAKILSRHLQAWAKDELDIDCVKSWPDDDRETPSVNGIENKETWQPCYPLGNSDSYIQTYTVKEDLKPLLQDSKPCFGHSESCVKDELDIEFVKGEPDGQEEIPSVTEFKEEDTWETNSLLSYPPDSPAHSTQGEDKLGTLTDSESFSSHQDDLNNPVTDDGNLSCPECSKTFTLNSNLLVHMRTHSSTQPSISTQALREHDDVRRRSEEENITRHTVTDPRTLEISEEEREVMESFSRLDNESVAVTPGTRVVVENEEGQVIIYEVLAELGRVGQLGQSPGEAAPTEKVLEVSSRLPKKTCPICGVEQTKLPRHMSRIHPGVQLPSPPPRPQKETIECSVCKKEVSRKNIKRHVKTHAKSGSFTPCESFRGRNLWVPVERTLSPQMKEVIRRLRDDVRSTVMDDDLIIQVTERCLMKNLHVPYAIEFVRAAARRLGLLLNRARNFFKRDDMSMEDLICVKNYTALEMIGKEWSENFKKPSNIVRMGEDLAKLRAAKFRNATESLNKNIMDEMSLFGDLLDKEWRDLRQAALNVIKKNKPENKRQFALPTDLAKFHSLANKKIQGFMKKSEFSQKDFLTFGKLILCRLMVFNFGRSSEMGRLEMAAYSASLGEGCNEASESGLLTQAEIQKVRAGAIRVIRHFGKRGYELATRIPLDLQKPFEKYILLREKFGGESELYVFFHPGVGGYLRGGEALREVIEILGQTDFKRPESLTARNLRKFATDIFDAIPNGENIAGKTFSKPPALHNCSPLRSSSPLRVSPSPSPYTSGADERTPHKRKIYRKLPWTPRSIRATSDEFSEIIKSKRAKLPGKGEIEEFVRKNYADTSLSQRKWSTIKDFVRNEQKKASKRSHTSESDSDES